MSKRPRIFKRPMHNSMTTPIFLNVKRVTHVQSDLSWYHKTTANHFPPIRQPKTSHPLYHPSHTSTTTIPSNNLPNLGTDPSTSIHINPIRARPRRHPSRNPFTRESFRLEHPHIPRAQPCTAQQDAAAEFERAVDGSDLGGGFGPAGREPVHAVHQDGDGQAGGLHAGEDLAELVGVDAQVVEGCRGGEARVGFWGEVGWVAFGGVLACGVGGLVRIRRGWASLMFRSFVWGN